MIFFISGRAFGPGCILQLDSTSPKSNVMILSNMALMDPERRVKLFYYNDS